MTHYSIAKQGECGPLMVFDAEIPTPNGTAPAALRDAVARELLRWKRMNAKWTGAVVGNYFKRADHLKAEYSAEDEGAEAARICALFEGARGLRAGILKIFEDVKYSEYSWDDAYDEIEKLVKARASPPPADAVASEDLVAKVRDALADLFTEGLNLREGVTLSFTTYARRVCALFEGAGGKLLASTVLAWLKERGGESWKATIRDVEYAIENLRSSPLAVASSTETPLSEAAKGYLGRMADEKATRASEPGLRELLEDAMQLLHGVGMWKHQDIEDQWRMSYKEVAERYAALARTPPQNTPCPYYCEPSHVVGEKCDCPCPEQQPQGDVSLE